VAGTPIMTDADTMPARATWLASRRVDALALVALVVLTVAGQAPYFADPMQPLFNDQVNFFVPMFAFMGEWLRAGHIPAWNPHQFAGAPFAGDPQSGWMSFLVMIPYMVLPVAGAVVAVNILHLSLAGVATYLFARSLRLNPAGAFAAAIVFEYTMLWQRFRCCPQIMAVLAWLPVMLLAAELAIRSRNPLHRAGWLLLGGLAVSQELAGWLGQGSYYQFLLVAGWIAFRTVLWPSDPAGSLVRRLGLLLLCGVGLFASGILLNAAALLPRLEYNAVSNVAWGTYQGLEAGVEADRASAWLLPRLFGAFRTNDWLYVGAGATALAALAPVAASRWRPWIFFSTGTLLFFTLGLPETWLIHQIADFIPMFGTLHSHEPHRILYGLTFPIAMLAGATVSAISGTRKPSKLVAGLALALIAFALGLIGLQVDGVPVMARLGVGAAVAAMSLVVLSMLAPRTPLMLSTVALALAAVLWWDSTGQIMLTGYREERNWFSGGFDQYLSRDGVAGFLLSRDPTEHRYFGFDPVGLGPEFSTRQAYIASWNEPHSPFILVSGNQATALGLSDVQGYNPVHPMRYLEWVRTLNGKPQIYRFGNVLPSGLESPLLDLINARYGIVALDDSERPEVARLAAAWPEVYRDGLVRVLENPEAAPRGWLVGETRVVAYGEALELLATGAVDGRTVALIEDPAAALSGGSDPSGIPVTVARPDSDRMEFTVTAPPDEPAMLVVSEVWDPNWTARVDGQTAPVHVVDHTLMGVRLEPGAREIVLRYEPRSLRIGLIVSMVTGLFVLGVWIACGLSVMRRSTAPTSGGTTGRRKRLSAEAGGVWPPKQRRAT
jgi:hypothetical protein